MSLKELLQKIFCAVKIKSAAYVGNKVNIDILDNAIYALVLQIYYHYYILIKINVNPSSL